MSLQAALVSGLLQPAYERLRGRITPRLERELEASQWWPADRLANLQWRELARLLDHARRRVPFYRDWFTDQGAEPADLIARRDLSPLPIVTRAQLMAAPDRFLAENPPAGSYMKATGGSSGRPLRFRLDPRSDQWRLAMSRRGYAWAGCQPGERQIYLWSSDFTPPGRLALAKRGLHRLLQGQIYIDSFHLGPAELDRALGLIGRFRPRCLVAFTSAALILARWALKRRWRPPASLVSIITGAEGLSQPDRELLERVFACPVFETYGSREFMLTAAECPAHAGLHVSGENLLLGVAEQQNYKAITSACMAGEKKSPCFASGLAFRISALSARWFRSTVTSIVSAAIFRHRAWAFVFRKGPGCWKMSRCRSSRVNRSPWSDFRGAANRLCSRLWPSFCPTPKGT